MIQRSLLLNGVDSAEVATSSPMFPILPTTEFRVSESYFGQKRRVLLREIVPRLPLKPNNTLQSSKSCTTPTYQCFANSPEKKVSCDTSSSYEAGEACFFTSDVFPTSLPGKFSLLLFKQSYNVENRVLLPSHRGIHNECFGLMSKARRNRFFG